LPILGLLMFAEVAGGLAVPDPGPPGWDYVTPVPLPDVEACLTHLVRQGRPKVSRHGAVVSISWGKSKDGGAPVRRADLFPEQGETHIHAWFGKDWMTQCAPIPTVPVYPG